ncbi:methylated-DNA--[protein]-cysteine S-methyltransferase [Pseudomonadota bacterium]
MKSIPHYQAILSSPVGPLGILIEKDALYSIDFLADDTAPLVAEDSLTAQVVEQLQRYFKQAEWHFSLSLRPVGTPFQLSVWQQLQQIPAGEVRTYGEIAKALGSGPRAVGNACRNNPLPVVVPCHRVVAASGPGGYAGQTQGRNMTIKRWLLKHEGITI